MCGICGGRFARGAEIGGGAPPPNGTRAQAIVRKMTDVQRHRGPDDEGYLFAGPVGLGFRRLSIIDLDTGHQPIGNEDGSVQVILNGEIYNYRELRKDLEARHTFRTRTDTEVIAHLYEERGAECFTQLNGMFCIAIVDRTRNRLVLARDRAGVKPVYWAWCGEDFAFASEIKALLEHPECPRAVDGTAFAEYLCLEYAPGPRTLFQGISELDPGHRLILDTGAKEPTIEPYWTLPPALPERMFTDRAGCTEELRALVMDAVRMRLVSDVPLGALLSGGLDSGIVVAAMREFATGPVCTVSVGFEGGGDLDETALARESARHFGTDHHEIRYGTKEALEILPELVWHNELPIAEPLIVPSFFLFREARKHVTVVLSGEGADELFGGYRRYRVLSELRRFRPFLPPASWGGWDALRAGPGVLNTIGKVGHAVAEREASQALWEWNSVFSAEEVAALMVDPKWSAGCTNAAYRPFPAMTKDLPPHELANQLMRIEIMNRLVDFILGRADKMSMANSLELRTPFLDYRLIEFSRRIPAAWKLGRHGEKLILRNAFERLLPEALRVRPKHAFQTPYRAWLTPLSERLVPESRLVRDGWLKREGMAALVGSIGHSDRAQKRLWSVLMLEMWYRKFISGEELPRFVGGG